MHCLAMHMANELLSPRVAFALIAAVAGFLAFAARLARRDLDESRVPLMGVMGAFVFAAQMINFPILPGTSGHICGAVLLAILLGPHAATLVMASILIVQCLIFQDGGLLALGANILNIGIVPAYLGHVCFHAIAGQRPGAGRLYTAVFVATILGMAAGAALVPCQVWASGVLAVPLAKFLAVMIGLHLLVGLVEAIVTFLVIGYLVRVRPQSLGPVAERCAAASAPIGRPAVLASLFSIAMLMGGVVSLFASEWPDALESRQTSAVSANESPLVAATTELQERTALLSEYQWTSFSGVVGAMGALLVVWFIGRALRPRHAHADPGPDFAER